MLDKDKACSINATLSVIGDRWTILILRDLFRGVRRFEQLRQDLGIAKNILSDRLTKLNNAGILTPGGAVSAGSGGGGAGGGGIGGAGEDTGTDVGGDGGVGLNYNVLDGTTSVGLSLIHI